MNIGFIGLGSMGQAMAANLLQAGFHLRVWNRSPDKADELVRLGATRVQHPADAVEPGGIVVTMVADDAALRQVVYGEQGIGQRLGRDGIHLSMSTIAPQTAQELAQWHAAQGSRYVAAPVFGRPDAAAARKLFVLSAGPAAAREAVLPLLQAMGQRVFDLGDDPMAANVLKLSGNFMILGVIEAMAEALTLGERYGLPRERTVDVLTQSIFPAPLFVNYGKQIAAHAYQPARFKLSLGLKDADLVLSAARQVAVPMPLAQLMQGRLLSAVAHSRGDLDWTAAALGASEDAGLQGAG
ncbi:MAG: NAD(P)-dependent oxidoreductase [Betaproteobacteria bacterium]|nr:NAD(P)-dependent oxidoreductase [Betaproteobacteria bacterium]